MATPDLGIALLGHARGAIAEKFGQVASMVANAAPAHEALDRPGATFVTLTQYGELRGCIGTLEAHRPLLVDVRENALAAAFRDPRFLPLTAREQEFTSVEVSLLTPARPMEFEHEEHLLAQLRPGTDGIVLSYGHYRSTFLPQVWDSLPEPRQFMAQLKRKAGLPADFWAESLNISRYEVTKWKEREQALMPQEDR
jgi:AmmeMemoRadiSam system protein A